MIAQGDININGQNRLPSIDDLKQQDTKTKIFATEAYIEASNFTNNGQLLSGNVIDIQLKNDLYNKNQGIIAANQFLNINAKNVYNQCSTETVHGEYDDYEVYLPSVLIGGDGKETDGVGAQIHTTGEVVMDASNLCSAGSNVILADGGMKSIAHSNMHTTYRQDESSWLGLNQQHEERKETIVGSSTIISSNGKNTISCKNGGIQATATNFSAANGTDIYAKDNAEFYGLIAATEESKSSQTIGIFYSDEKMFDEYSCPTMIQDQKNINIVSESDVLLQDSIITTPGHLHVKTENFSCGVSKLTHTYESSSFGISTTLCDQKVLSVNNPCDFSQPLFNGVPTLNQLQQLANSHGVAETLLNGAKALVNGKLLQEVKRELHALSAPQLGINFTHTNTSTYSESLGEGGIFVGSADFDVDNTIKIKSAPIQVEKDCDINCETMIIEGDQLQSYSDQHSQNLNLTISSAGDPCEVKIGTTHEESAAIMQVNEHIQVGGTLTIHANKVVQDGATIDVGHIKGEINNYKIITHADETHCKSGSMGASTGGDFNFSKQKSDSKIVNQASELHVHDSINGTTDEFVVHYFESTGGKITSDGQNNFKADTIDAKVVEEYKNTSGFCIKGNVKDHLLPPKQQSTQNTTTNLNFNNSHYKAEVQTVVYGAEGSDVQSEHINGNIVANSSDGRKITKNSSHTYNPVLPHITPETKQQIQWVESKIKQGADKIEQVITNFFKLTTDLTQNVKADGLEQGPKNTIRNTIS